MNLEIGKTYLVTNHFKKSYVEEVFYAKEDNIVKLTTRWGSGTWAVTPDTKDELVKLEDFMDKEFDAYINPSEEFLNTAFINSSERIDESWETVEGSLDIYNITEGFNEDEESSEHLSLHKYLEEDLDFEMNRETGYFINTSLDITPK